MKGFNLESSPRTPPSAARASKADASALPSTSACAHVPLFPSRSQMLVPTASLAQTPPYRFSPPSHTVTPSVTPSPPSTPSSIGCWSIESPLRGHTLDTTNGTSDGVQIDERPLTEYSSSRPGGTGNNHTIIPTFRPHQYPYPGLPAGVPPTAYTQRQGYCPPGPTVPILWPDVSPEWGPYAPPPQLRPYPFYAPFDQSVLFTGAMFPSSYQNPFLLQASRTPTQLYNITPPLPNIFTASARHVPHLAKASRYIPGEKIAINNLQGQKVEMKESKRSHAGHTITQPPTLARWFKPSKAERRRLKAIQVEATRLQRVKDWLEKHNGAATDTDNGWLKPSKAERKRLKAIQNEATRLQRVKDWLEKHNGVATDTDNEASEKAAANEKMNVPAADPATATAPRAAKMAARHAVTTAIRANAVARRAFAAAVDAADAANTAVAAAAAALKAATDSTAALRDMKEQNSEIVTKPADKDVNQSLEHAVEEMAAEQDGPRPELSDLHTEEDERSAASRKI